MPDRPSAAMKVLGSMLRNVRVGRSVGLQAAEVVRGSRSKISRLERGESPPKHHDVMGLLHAYGVREPATPATVEDLLRKSDEKPWWHRYADVTAGWLRRLISQMGFLLEAIERQWVWARIVRFAGATDLTPPSSMALSRFPHGGPQEMLYLEHVEAAAYISRCRDVERYRAHVERLYLAAESRSRSRSKEMLAAAHLRFRAQAET
ncbi:Scr1 family TA system antitoxin-like transcriptional regulator [Embleya sp. NPDC056575]|uniref:Scr1 family TA system antitoxin-like transcriptional regulator n=1 Tax=unclassified Embleya TaxID=2699296 RepID=UPI0036A2E445